MKRLFRGMAYAISLAFLHAILHPALGQSLPGITESAAGNPNGFDLGTLAAGSGGGGGIGSGASQGDPGTHTSTPYLHNTTAATGKQIAARLTTQTCQLDKVYGGSLNRLPPTRLDGFVRDAGGSADQIYGDEGSEGPPPFFGFDEGHRIERGIQSGGLTTGHRSNLPEAWGWPQ